MGANPYKAERTYLVSRWRLEPKPEDMEKYKRGELVEPVKPIVFYIDRNTPKFLQPYFVEAVNLWQPVFEKIRFKNAIIGKISLHDALPISRKKIRISRWKMCVIP